MAKKKVGKKVGASKKAPAKKTISVKQVPTGVKVIAVLEYIGAAIEFICGLIFIIFSGVMSTASPAYGALGSVFLIGLGILMIGVGVLYFFLGRGLWRAQDWARITVIVFSGIGVLVGLIYIVVGVAYPLMFAVMFILGLIMAAVAGLIGGYLLFAKEVKDVFEK